MRYKDTCEYKDKIKNGTGAITTAKHEAFIQL